MKFRVSKLQNWWMLNMWSIVFLFYVLCGLWSVVHNRISLKTIPLHSHRICRRLWWWWYFTINVQTIYKFRNATLLFVGTLDTCQWIFPVDSGKWTLCLNVDAFCSQNWLPFSELTEIRIIKFNSCGKMIHYSMDMCRINGCSEMQYVKFPVWNSYLISETNH